MTTVCEAPQTPKTVTAEDLLSLRNQAPIEPFEIPSLGTVYVHGLSNVEARQWNQSCAKNDQGTIDDDYADAKLIVRCVRDANGRRIFEERHVTQIVELPELIVTQLVGTCMKLCGLGKDAEATILKNYPKTGTGNS